MIQYEQLTDKSFLNDLGTKFLEVDKLIPYALNSRKHSDHQVLKIASSIKEFGFLNPVIIDKDNGIIAGHGRVLGAKKIGLKYVPVVDASHLSETQKKAYVIADNKIALESEWDDEILKLEMTELTSLNYDLDFTGFDLPEIESLFDDEIKPEEVDPPALEDREHNYQEMNFTLHNEQAKFIELFLRAYKPQKNENNTNRNGNTLYEVFKAWEKLNKLL